MTKINLTDPLPLVCWTEYWEAKYLLPRSRIEFGNEHPEVVQLALRIKLFEEAKNLIS